MSGPSKGWVLSELDKIVKAHEAKARHWRAHIPVEQDEDETLRNFRERQAADEIQRSWAIHYALEEDARSNVIRQAIVLISAGKS